MAWLDSLDTREAVRRAPEPSPGRPATARAVRSRQHRCPPRSRPTEQRPVPRRSHEPRQRARGACRPGKIGEPLGLSLEQAAEGILQIANANMVKAIGLVTVERGFDPRVRVSSPSAEPGGSCGRPRAPASLPEVIVPLFPGVTSALGPALRRPARGLLLGVREDKDEIDLGDIRRHFGEMGERVGSARQGVERSLIEYREKPRPTLHRAAPLITVSIDELSEEGLGPIGRSLPRRAPAPVPLLASRASRGDVDAPSGRPRPAREARPLVAPGREARSSPRAGATSAGPLRRYGWLATQGPRPELARPRRRSPRPAIVDQLDSTIVLPPDTAARVDEVGNVIISTGEDV